MDTMNYYEVGPTSALDYRHSPSAHHHGYAPPLHHGAYHHPTFAQSIGLRVRPSAQIAAASVGGGVGASSCGTPPRLYGAVGTSGGAVHPTYDAVYRDRYAHNSATLFGVAPSESRRMAYGSRMTVASPSNSAGGGYPDEHIGYNGYATDSYSIADSYRHAKEHPQYHHQQHSLHTQRHQRPLHHLQHPPFHHYANSEIMYAHHHHPTAHHHPPLNQLPSHNHHHHHLHHPHFPRNDGGYTYFGYPSGAELAYQQTPYQHHHHHPLHEPTIIPSHTADFHSHQTSFPIPRAPSRDLYGAGAAEAHSSTTASQSSASTVHTHSAPTISTEIDPLAATTPAPAATTPPSCEAVAADDAPTTTTSSSSSSNATHTHSSPSPFSSSPSPSIPSTKTSPPSANGAATVNEIRSTAAAVAPPTAAKSAANGSIFGGNAVERPAAAPDRREATPFMMGGGGGGAGLGGIINGSTLLMAEETRGANCTYPTPPPSTAPIDATVYANASKEPTLKKRDKHLSKLAAMNRRLEEYTTYGAPTMRHEIERVGTPFAGGNALYRDYSYMRTQSYSMLQHAIYDNHPMISSQTTRIPMSSPWHPMTSNGSDWMNTQQNRRSNSYYRTHRVHDFEHPLMSQKPFTSPSKHGSSGDNVKTMSNVLESDFIPSKKRRKVNKTAPIHEDSAEIIAKREALKKIAPLPGFQQAFGSTEIGRFSEVFFNAPESPAEPFRHFSGNADSEAETLSPQPWETGDSMEGTNFNMPPSNGSSVQSRYADSYTSSGSPSSSYFSDLRCCDF